MTERELWRRRARRAARDVLRRCGVQAAGDIRLEAIARAAGLSVIEGPLEGARARLGGGPRPVIRISDAATVPGSKRFSLAHEIGHHVLRHPLSCATTLCGELPAHETRDATARDHEAEANLFAAELLMPRALVAPRCGARPPTLQIPRSIAEEFQTSLHASAVRFAELTTESCAVTYSERSSVVWATTSRRFANRIVPGAPIDDRSLAHTVTDVDREGMVPVQAWLPWLPLCSNAEPPILFEHSSIADPGGVLTLLWHPGAPREPS